MDQADRAEVQYQRTQKEADKFADWLEHNDDWLWEEWVELHHPDENLQTEAMQRAYDAWAWGRWQTS